MKRKIKIGVDGGDFVPGRSVRSGIQRIVDSFLKEIKKQKNYRINYYHFGPDGLPRLLFSSIQLPLGNAIDKNDIFLGFSGRIPPFLSFSTTKKIVFLYDLGFIKYPKFYANPQRLLRRTLQTVKIADYVVVSSEYSMSELLRQFSFLDKSKIAVIYPGIDHLPKVKTAKNTYGDYLLYVGVIKPIKNIEKVFRYFVLFLKRKKNKDCKLILIGKKEQDYFEHLKKDKNYLKAKDKVVFINGVSDSELVKYYLNAKAVVNFSYEEGFCFPIAEALYLGKKIIVDNLPVYKELTKKHTWSKFTEKLLKL